MSLLDDVNEQIDKTIRATMSVTKKQESNTKVPDASELGYADGKLLGNATYLYTDMRNSSGLAATNDKVVAAQVFRAFLNVSTKIIRAHDGHIRSFDGDRVMGVFTGLAKEDRAVRSAMEIKWAVKELVTPAIHSEFPTLKANGWNLKQVSGIATGETLLARAGFRGNDDMIALGVAPNLAAKLSDLRESDVDTYDVLVGAGTHSALSAALTKSKDGDDMWVGKYTIPMGGGNYNFYKTRFWMPIK